MPGCDSSEGPLFDSTRADVRPSQRLTSNSCSVEHDGTEASVRACRAKRRDRAPHDPSPADHRILITQQPSAGIPISPRATQPREAAAHEQCAGVAERYWVKLDDVYRLKCR